jgi:hypothetical protein
MKCKVGSVVVATNQGLGYLMLDFFKNKVIDKVLLQESPWFKSNPEWYGKDQVDLTSQENFPYTSTLTSKEKKRVVGFLKSIDLLLFFETPFNYEIIRIANEMNVKCILIPMYECTLYPIEVDAYLAPSLLDLQYYNRLYPNKLNKFIRIPIPNEIKWKRRTRALTFVHNSGNGGVLGRNGTEELIEAMKYVTSPIELIIRSQSKDYINYNNDPRIKITKKHVPFAELWDEGDVFIFPEKFNGLSLPIQEAYASGLLIMSGNRFPFNAWLPPEALIPVQSYDTISIVNIPIQRAIYNPRDIAATIDQWYNKDIEDYSIGGREWGKQSSWDALRNEYQSFFEEVINENINH